ncbi:MAG: signal peptidase I [DPANN group archaeon]|nr:signal peptidase I [DPANN group archaeon]
MKKILKQIEKILKEDSILNDLIWVLTGILIALLIYYGMGLILTTTKPMVTVISESMYPTLTRGDMLILKGIDPSDIKVGDIIVYNYAPKNKLIVHRIYNINEDGTFKTKGDNNETNKNPDPWIVQPEWVVGTMIYQIPKLGYPRIIIGETVQKIYQTII